MKLIVNYADGVINLPRSVTKSINTATREDLAALIALMSEPRAAESLESCRDAIAASAGITSAQLDASLAFWRGAGIIRLDAGTDDSENIPSTAPSVKSTDAPTQKPAPKRSSPDITGEEAEALIAASPACRSLLNECQQIIGHMFNNSESATILSLREYLGLEDEYILLLLAYCARNGKKQIKYAEKMAYSLYNDRGIETAEALSDYLMWLEASRETEGRLRSLLGMGSRAFTQKQREFFERWLREFGYDYDMIEAAYNATVDAINTPSMPYMNKILESWHDLGFKTPGDVNDARRDRKTTDVADTFDTEDFFRLAVMRGSAAEKTDKN